MCPWPAVTGNRLRLSNIVSTISDIADVDLFIFGEDREITDATIQSIGRVRFAPFPSRTRTKALRHFLTGNLPFELSGRDFQMLRREFKTWRSSTYDAIWVSRPYGYVALRGLFNEPVIVDFDDLEDVTWVRKHRAYKDSRWNTSIPLLELVATSLLAERNAQRWSHLQREIAQDVAAAVVTSRGDQTRLGGTNVHVVPNGYTRRSPIAWRAEPLVPTILFVGWLEYEANVDAAFYLVRSIAPLIRDHIPNLQIRLVGKPTKRVMRLDDPPRVVVTGEVRDIADELSRATLLLAPIRFGSGTRIKLLEAFAHSIPVVATQIAADGIEVVPERDLLIGDTPEELSVACVRLLQNPDLRRQIARAAKLVAQQYDWSRSGELVERVLRSTMADQDDGRVTQP